MSVAAVSFAVNDRPGVGEATRARILAAADDLGWEPSAPARALTDARARAVGLVLARDPGELESDAFFARFVAGLERTLAPHDHALLLQLAPRADPRPYLRLAASRRVDGFVICDVARDDPRFAPLAAAGIAAVVAGHPGPDCPFPWLETRHGEGMALAARHLVDRGHERIGFLGGPPELDYVQTRLERWRAALRDAGLPLGPVVCGGPPDALAAAGVTAVAATSDVLASAVLAADPAIAVTGFDDSPLAVHGGLTSVRVDYAAFGAAAAAALLATIAGEAVETPRLALPELVVRASTAGGP